MDHEKLGQIDNGFDGFEMPKLAVLESPNQNVRMIVRMLGEEKVRQLDAGANRLAAQEFMSCDSAETVTEVFTDYMQEFRGGHGAADFDEIKNYTGFNYKYINSVLRGQWDYDELGRKDDDKEREMVAAAEHLSEIIAATPELPENTTTYRGTNLESFRDYGATTLADLHKLEGQLCYETGFTSTSLVREQSFYGRDFDDEYRRDCNIEVEYLLPQGSRDGVLAATEDLSYSPEQSEYIIDKSSLFKVTSVVVDGDQAHVQMALIPKADWN